MSRALSEDDPAYWMLREGWKDPEKAIQRKLASAYSPGCYICEDPEFALMGLPLCWHCEKCGGHVPADDIVCTDCGHEHFPEESSKEVP